MNKAELAAQNLLKKFNISEAPVPIKKLVRLSKVKLSRYDLGDDISGILVVENGVSRIGYSPYESEVRQRFTIAHELGHFILHMKEKENGLFVDNVKVMYRKQAPSRAQLLKEREANEFAANILMPFKLIKDSYKRITKKDELVSDDEIVKRLSRKFKVSQSAMTYRLYNLGLINYY
jgi:hypothetical protein